MADDGPLASSSSSDQSRQRSNRQGGKQDQQTPGKDGPLPAKGAAGGGPPDQTNAATTGSTGTMGSTGAAGSGATNADTGIDGAMRIEVDLLAHGTLTKIADAVAVRCCEATAETTRIIVASHATAAAVGLARLLHLEMRALLDQVRGQLSGRQINAPEALALPTLSKMASRLADVGSVVSAAKSVLDKFVVVDKYDSREVKIGPEQIAAILATRLREHRKVVVLHIAAAFPDPLGGETLRELMIAVEQLAGAKLDPADVEPARLLAAKTSELLEALRAANPSPLGLLSVLDRYPDSPVLSAELLAAGGAYRTRSHLFTVLGLADKLSLSAGSGILWTLTDPESGAMLDGDLHHDWSGRIRLPRVVGLRSLSNLLPHKRRVAPCKCTPSEQTPERLYESG